MRILLAAAAAVACLTAADAAGAATLLINGGFEDPGGANRRDGMFDGLLPGWVYSSNGTGFEIYESSGQDIRADGAGVLNAADGSHYVSFGHSGGYGGTLSQTFATTVGETYTVNYFVAEQQAEDPLQNLQAQLTSGGAVFTADNLNLGATFAAGHAITFVAAGTTATLVFRDATDPDRAGGASNLALDAVSVTQGVAGGGAPEPAAWALMVIGLGCAGGMLRHRAAARRLV